MIDAALQAPVKLARSFAPRSVPSLSRHNYRWELTSAFFVPTAVACVEGGVIGVIAKKGFGASDLVIATLTAAPALANITSVIWTRVLHGKDRVRATTTLQLLTLSCVALMIAAPFNTIGIAILVLAQLLARSFLTGIITARADLWRANYPRKERAKITGRLTVVVTLIVSITAVTIGWAMDIPRLGGHGFRYVYAAAICTALIGVWAFTKLRWRGRAAHLAAERSTTLSTGKAPGPREMIRILRSDVMYRRYMIAQFALGVPNLAAIPVFIVALEDHMPHIGYGQSIALTQVLTVLVPMLMIPVWAKLLDRMHIIRYRMFHSWSFVLANLLMGIGFLFDSLWMLYVSRIVLGAAFAGGMLAWQLGHHDFAKRDLAHIYMGIHVTLTGVRGAFAPFMGTIMYAGSLTLAGHTFKLMPAMDAWTFIALAALSAVGAVMFYRLHRDTRDIAQVLDQSD